MGSIQIVGLGPGNKGHISLETIRVMKSAHKVILRTEIHPTVALLKEENINYECCDHFYEENKDFSAVYNHIVEYVLKEAKDKDVVYAVPGSPLVAEKTVVLLRDRAKKENTILKILPAMSFLDLIYTRIGIDPIEGVRIIDAGDTEALKDAGKYPLIITQVYSKLVASELKLALMERLEDETEVIFLRNLGLSEEEFLHIPLFELDRQPHIDHLTTIYIPKFLKEGVMDLNPLIDVVRVLRKPEGCPWDREQTHESLRKALIEEVYELLESIDDKDAKGMREELGDVLLQVVFHARLAEEEGTFTMQDVIDDVVTKLIRRHPHVFGTIEVADSEEVLKNWEEIKAKEKTERKHALDGISRGLPALMRAYKLQGKAAKVGFDWDKKEEVWAKVEEEIEEVKEAVKKKDLNEVEWELGDALFALSNYIRHMGLEPESALNRANNRFKNRFEFIEKEVTTTGRPWVDFSLEELEKLWQKAKKSEKN